MDKNEEKDDRRNEDPNSENYSSNDDIPLWLQGLDRDDHDNHESIDSSEDVEDSWVPEITEELSDDDQIFIEDEDTDAPIEPRESNDYKQTHDEEETNEIGSTEEIEIDKLPNGAYADDIGPTLNDTPTSEGFLDISDMESSQASKDEELSFDEETLIEGDLPEWLQEMIAEQEKTQTSDIDDELFDESGLDENETLEQETTSQETPSPETISYDQANDEGDLILEDQSNVDADLEEDYLPEDDLPPTEEKDLIEDWLSEDELESDKRFSDEDDFYLSGSYQDIDKEKAFEIAEDETKPIKVSPSDEEDVSSEVEEQFIEEIEVEDEAYLAESTEEPFDEEIQVADEEELETRLEEPFLEESHLEEEDLSLSSDEPHLEDLQEEDQVEFSPTAEEPFFDESQSKEEEEEDISLSLQDPYVDEALTIEDEEDLIQEEEDTSKEEPGLMEDEDQLEVLKHHLTYGNFDEAFPTINKFIEDASHLEKLELWLREATESNAETNSEIWELLGDVTFRQNKPEDAYNAYAKAIRQLLMNDEVSDETR